jgi:catechol-2,3-dioxygenase
MDLTAGFGPMRFASYDRYHHHLGINLLNGPGAARVEDDVAGLDFFEISRPELQPGTLIDPDGISLHLTP